MDRHYRRALPGRLVLTVGAMSVVLAGPAFAQNVVVTSSGEGKAMMSRGPATLPISNDAVRALISAHLPSVLQAGSEDNYVVLVVDAYDQYVSGKASKATTVVPGQGPVVIHTTSGDSVGAATFTVRSTNGDAAVAAAGAISGAMSTFFIRSGDSTSVSESNGVFGTGFKMTDVSSIGLKRFAAGDLSEQLVMVSVVKLK